MAVRWGIVGCGDVCEVKSGPGFQKAHGSELVAVMRRTANLAEDFAKRHNVPRWHSNADQLISDPNVDVVYIATPPGSHLEIASKVAAAGKPAYVEKPMARNASECQEMIQIFEEKNLPLFIAYYRRCLPRFQKVAKLLPRLGRLTRAGYTYRRKPLSDLDPLPWRLDARLAGGGLFLDMGCHALDLLDHLLGPLQNVTGTASNVAKLYEVEDTVSMEWSWENGIKGTADFHFSGDEDRDEFLFKGEHGSLRAACFDVTPLVLRVNGTEELIEAPNPPHVHQPMIQAIVNELNGAGSSPSTGTTALRTNLVMDQVLENYYGGRSDEFWKRDWPKTQ